MMSRKEKIQFYIAEIKKHKAFLASNREKLEIYEGDLLPKVQAVMKATLNKNYYAKIEKRIIPVNVLTRIVSKLSKVYITPPVRQTKDKNVSDNELMTKLSEDLDLDVQMGLADEYSNLFKGYALRPFIDEDKPGVRVLPYDRFIALGLDKVNPMRMTDYLEFMGFCESSGADKKKCELWHAYTNDEFYAFLDNEEEYAPDLEENKGINPIGKIPAVYGNRSRLSICPTEDTDITQMAIMIPVLLSDLAGAIMFQCFTIIYGIDVKFTNLVMSPNAFWKFTTDPKSDKAPQIGTIKPEADIDKVLNFIKQVLAFWLETKGVRIGSLNNLDAGNAASGIAKIIDEMDVYEIKKQQINFFKKEEKQFWLLMKDMMTYWTKAYENYKPEGMFSETFQPYIEFDEPRPEVSRETQVRTVTAECQGGFLDKKSAIIELYPNLGPEELKARYEALGLGDVDLKSFDSESLAKFMLAFLESLSPEDLQALLSNREDMRAAADGDRGAETNDGGDAEADAGTGKGTSGAKTIATTKTKKPAAKKSSPKPKDE